jgi:hypothetical protein
MKITQEQADELADTGSVEVDGETIKVQLDLVTQFGSDWQDAQEAVDNYNVCDSYDVEDAHKDGAVDVIVPNGRKLWRGMFDELEKRGWDVVEVSGTGRVQFSQQSVPTAEEVVEQIQNEYGSGYAHVSHIGPDEKNPYVAHIFEIEIPDGWKKYKKSCYLVRDN